MTDPIRWFEECVFTQDQHDPSIPAKPFPRYKDAPWLYKYIEALMEERRLAAPKSRQMIISWTTVGFLLHNTQFRPNVNTFFISKKQRDANKLLRRAKFIYAHQPFPRQVLDLVHTIRAGGGDFGTASTIEFYPPKKVLDQLKIVQVQSKIESLSQESDDIRMETATNIFFDEVAFLDNASEIFRAVVPTIDKYGNIYQVSTPNGKEYFCRTVFDLEEDEEVDPMIPPHEELVKGVMKWRNEKNGFCVLRIHYSADPKKDPDTEEGKEWYDQVVRPLPDHIKEQEFEINFAAKGEKRIWPHFDITNHVGVFKAPQHCVLYRGWDFGRHWPCCVVVYDNTMLDRFEVLQVFLGREIAFRNFADTVISWCHKAWPARAWLEGCDPHGSWSNPHGMEDEGGAENPVSYLQMKYEVDIDWDYCKPEDGRDLITSSLMKRPGAPEDVFPFGINKTQSNEIYRRMPNTVIYAGTQVLIEGMAGGCHYPKKSDGTFGTQIVKNKYSHPADALMHAFLRARRQKEDREETRAWQHVGVKIVPPEPDEFGINW